ncbi:ribonuclease E [Saccharobesus litoralis]|uniref:Ribonuclease E n=1 Tax=Saccharobesus litoralis TaxID=2172099 RepID=A0A2S0VNH2_9ALTE|nr:di-heme-cytochrome C peroxidase [Saccharobesus litoralis]AWB65746.1 ribonuclease E [Saccharobesus litoralis]
MATLFQNLLTALYHLYKRKWLILGIVIGAMVLALIGGKIYQNLDKDQDRGAIPIENGAFGESYQTPIYLEQGWSEADSLWFYNTTQGSGLMPYDLFIALEQADSQELFRSNANMDKYRYLPQKPTFFNPDGLPVGFVKDTYQGRDNIGYTCAACHTGQVNYTGKDGKTTAIRIDGGPAMADMVGFLTALEKSLQATLEDSAKQQRFVKNVIALNNDYSNQDQVLTELEQAAKTIRLYNTVNHSHIDYGYARLDAFGRIYNRVLQHMISKPQLARAMSLVTAPGGRRILTDAQINNVLAGIDENIIVDSQFSEVIERLMSKAPGMPGLGVKDMLRVRNAVFNEPDAPVSYPFLWDIAQSDYVQWNGLANNASVGPLGRNTGEVIGVFGILDWTSHKKSGFSLSAYLTKQDRKNEVIDFKSSIDVTNLQRLEAHLKSLKSPVWPESILGKIDQQKAERGRLLYAQYCESCHEVIDRNNYDRVVIANMMDIDKVKTDPAMAVNSVTYTGKSGNFQHTTQSVDGVGDVFIQVDAPVVQILTSATKGVIATPDADKTFIRRWLDRLYVIGLSLFTNDMPATVKKGDYRPDTTTAPYNSLLAYKGRSLNGIWATAPYLHNGSVPTLYDLLLPKKRPGDPEVGEYRPDEFVVGSRELDTEKVGFRSSGYDGFKYQTMRVGDLNSGHEYAAGKTAQMDGTVLPALSQAQRWDLVEYLKTL